MAFMWAANESVRLLNQSRLGRIALNLRSRERGHVATLPHTGGDGSLVQSVDWIFPAAANISIILRSSTLQSPGGVTTPAISTHQPQGCNERTALSRVARHARTGCSSPARHKPRRSTLYIPRAPNAILRGIGVIPSISTRLDVPLVYHDCFGRVERTP